ncbi:hypothetical protein [Pseudomonas sp. 18173]
MKRATPPCSSVALLLRPSLPCPMRPTLPMILMYTFCCYYVFPEK